MDVSLPQSVLALGGDGCASRKPLGHLLDQRGVWYLVRALKDCHWLCPLSATAAAPRLVTHSLSPFDLRACLCAARHLPFIITARTSMRPQYIVCPFCQQASCQGHTDQRSFDARTRAFSSRSRKSSSLDSLALEPTATPARACTSTKLRPQYASPGRRGRQRALRLPAARACPFLRAPLALAA